MRGPDQLCKYPVRVASRPMIPKPMCASWIMDTSLTPSPMAAVTGRPGELLTSLMTSDFCSGDRRQQTTP